MKIHIYNKPLFIIGVIISGIATWYPFLSNTNDNWHLTIMEFIGVFFILFSMRKSKGREVPILATQTPQFILKKMAIVYYVIFIWQLAAIIIAFTFTGRNNAGSDSMNEIFKYEIPVMAGVAFIVSAILFKRNINTALGKETLLEKLMLYQSAFIISVALLAGTSFFGTVIFWKTDNSFFLITPCVVLLFFIFIRPTKSKIEKDLNISFGDKTLLSGE
jgi:hypothetical protein